MEAYIIIDGDNTHINDFYYYGVVHKRDTFGPDKDKAYIFYNYDEALSTSKKLECQVYEIEFEKCGYFKIKESK